MENNKIQEAVFARVDGWEGLYLDGKLYSQNDSLNLGDQLDGKTVKLTYRGFIEADEVYTDDEGFFPDTLDELLEHERQFGK